MTTNYGQPFTWVFPTIEVPMPSREDWNKRFRDPWPDYAADRSREYVEPPKPAIRSDTATIVDNGNDTAGLYVGQDYQGTMPLDNARRFAAAWNACRGMSIYRLEHSAEHTLYDQMWRLATQHAHAVHRLIEIKRELAALKKEKP